jgi:hypothetical protein
MVQKKKRNVLKRKPVSKVYEYYNDTYGFFTYLYIGDTSSFIEACQKDPISLSKESAESLLSSLSSKSSVGCTFALANEENGHPSCWLIYVNSSVDTTPFLTTLSHECSHTAFFALEARGWSTFNTLDTQHTQIYLSDAIYENFLNKMSKDKILKISK